MRLRHIDNSELLYRELVLFMANALLLKLMQLQALWCFAVVNMTHDQMKAENIQQKIQHGNGIV